MATQTSRFRIGSTALIVLLPTVLAGAWFGRALYDRQFMLEGQVVVVNATAEDHAVRFVFPAGEAIEVDLKAGASSRSVVGATGEGAIDVTIDGAPRDQVGYVTSMNGMMVFTIGENRVIFTQVSL